MGFPMCIIWDINLSVWKTSSANSDSPELFRLVFDLQEDAKGSSSDDIGLGLCPIPEGCCRPADCSSVLKTAMIARIVASSTWDHGFEGALIRRRNKLCHFCLNCKRRVAACFKKKKFYFSTHTFEAFLKNLTIQMQTVRCKLNFLHLQYYCLNWMTNTRSMIWVINILYFCISYLSHEIDILLRFSPPFLHMWTWTFANLQPIIYILKYRDNTKDLKANWTFITLNG